MGNLACGPYNSQSPESSPMGMPISAMLHVYLVDVPRPGARFQHDGEPTDGTASISKTRVWALQNVTPPQYLYCGYSAMDCKTECLWETYEWINRSYEMRRFRDPDFQLVCFELSLLGSLDSLSEMKNLRLLEITRIAHKIG
ncbi:hypothetical protein BG003_000585, partial [Podila horticola]